MTYSGTSKWTLPAVATAALFIVFGLYMSIAVPVLEGKSASQIPKIDPLGLFKSESAGQWISLFSADSWQRNEENRNIIKADGNILVFQDYHQQDDGTLKVTRLCLLLFDKQSKGKNGEVDLDGKHYPTVIEAVDGAVISFDQSRPLAMGKYGEVQQIQFLGQVQFWKESRDPEKVFFLQTHQLLVDGQRATTHYPVQFRFGDSMGRAVGLDLRFDNPDLQKTTKPAVTQVKGINLVRFGNLQHVALKIAENARQSEDNGRSVLFAGNANDSNFGSKSAAKEPREVELKCDGPAEFYFDQLYANFHRNVQVIDRESDYQLNGELVQILFSADPATNLVASTGPASNSTSKPSPFLPKGLKPQRVIAQGNGETGTPAKVSHTKESTALTAAQLEYDLVGQQFVATATIPGTPGGSFPEFVKLTANGLSLQVPQLRYRPAKSAAGANSKLLGEVWAEGAGQLTQAQAGKKVHMSWEDQFTLADDKELPDHKVFSVYGNAKVRTDGKLEFDADRFHFWVKSSIDPLTQQQQFTPDLLVAQNHVRFLDEKMAGQFENAKIYFPADAKPLKGKLSGQQKQQLRSAVVRSVASNLVRLARPSFSQFDLTTTKEEDEPAKGTSLQARSLVMTLRSTSELDQKSSYEPAQIQLIENVSLIESDFSGATPQPLAEPGYHLLGTKITGVAQGRDINDKPQFAWQIEGNQNTEASVVTPQVTLLSRQLQFDQTANHIWSETSGSLSFPLQHSSSLLGSIDDEKESARATTGSGSITWRKSMSFDGRAFRADGQVQCDIEQKKADNTSQKIRANSQSLVLRLTSPIQFNGKKPERAPQIRSLQLSGEASNPNNPVRLYQQEFDADSNLIGQEAVWAPSVDINKQKQLITLNGRGNLWSVRQKAKKPNAIMQVSHEQEEDDDGALTHIQVEFEKGLSGDIAKGQFVFSGPVRTLFGSSDQWRIANAATELKNAIKLDCDQLTMNRWQVSSSSEPEMELDAAGSVHVIGQQFESLAERLKYNRNQDLLTIEGDTRTAAKFWQDNPETRKRNEIVAQKIWYRPKSRWFNCEGFKGGDLTFFAGQK